MSQFENCIRSAQRQGMLNEEEADALIERYAEHRRARAEAGAADADGAARTALLSEIENTAAVRQAVADGGMAARDRIADFARSYRDLSGRANVFEAFANLIDSKAGGTVSWTHLGDAIARSTHAELEQLLDTFRRARFSGRRFNKPLMDDVVREALGQPTGKPEAQSMAQAISTVFEKLRTKFNEKAGFEAIGRLERYLPQYHNAQAVLGKGARAGYEEWRDFITPLLDLDRMRDPLTGGRLTPERLEQTLNVTWKRIVTDGWSDREPKATPFGTGALATQRSEHRFLHFKDADSWLAYNQRYGKGDPTKAIFEHIRGMSQDIAAMQIFGPNPNATLHWMQQVVQKEAAKAVVGEPSLHGKAANEETGARLANRLKAIYNAARGPEVVSSRMANGVGDISNILTSAYLGSTSILAAATDPFIDRAARALNGFEAPRKAVWGIAHAIKNNQTRAEAIRSGLGLDDFLHILGGEARYAGTLGGHEWSKWLADRTMNVSGLEAITQARRHRFGLDFQAMAADFAGKTWDELGTANPYFRRALENYGFKPGEWDRLRATAAHIPAEGSAGYLRPVDVRNEDLGQRYLAMILGETERAVPTGTARSRSIVNSNFQRGTVFGELLNSGLQFKSFVLSFTAAQWQALAMEAGAGGLPRGAKYAAALAIPLTLGGALAVQLNNVIGGKDLQPMDPTTGQGFKFWLQSMLKGGGLGLMGDFLFQDMTRFGHSVGEQLSGPTISLISDIFKLTTGNLQKVATGKKTSFARDAIKTAGRNVPIVSSLPYTRAAYQRMFLDQLQYLADPEAHKHFREQEQRLRRETGQGFTWRPGQALPERLPEFAPARR